MTFTPNIPTAVQSLDQTRDAIRDNFTNYNTLVSQDHFGPNTGNQGKHQPIHLPEAGSDPTTAVNEGSLYVKQGFGNLAQLFYRGESDGSVIPITGPQNLAASGYCRMFGLLFQWAKVTWSGSGGTQSVTFPTAFTSAPYCIQLTPSEVTNPIGSNPFMLGVTGTPNTTSFTAIRSGTLQASFYYLAVGV